MNLQTTSNRELTFFHSGDLGDIIAALPIIRHVGGAHLVLGNNPHLPKDCLGPRHPMYLSHFNWIAPLLKTVPYIKSLSHSNCPAGVTHDLTTFRTQKSLSEKKWKKLLTQWQAEHLGIDFSTIDLSEWISVPPSPSSKGRAVFARSVRYLNPQFEWPVFVDLYRDALFVGTENEREVFNRQFNTHVQYVFCGNAFEMARLIAGSEIFIGNQSFPCWLAMAMGHPLIQETFTKSPNSIVARENARFIGATSLPPTIKSKPIAKLPAAPAPANPAIIQVSNTRGIPDFKGNIVVVLPVCKRELDLMKEDIKWHGELNGTKEHSCILSVDGGVSDAEIAMLETLAKQAYSTVSIYIYPPPPQPAWPQAPNWAFQHTARYMYSIGKPWFWMEADCTPLRPTWMTHLNHVYNSKKKPLMGSIVAGMGHCNGTAIYPANFCELSKKAMTCTDRAWDGEMRDETIRLTHDASQIMQHVWGVKNGVALPHSGDPAVFKSWSDVARWVNPKAYVFHRCKNTSLIEQLRKKNAEISKI